MRRDRMLPAPGRGPTRWAAWSGMLASRWQRGSRWRQPVPFVWLGRLRARSSVVLRLVRLYAPSFAVQLFPRLSMTYLGRHDAPPSSVDPAIRVSAPARILPLTVRSTHDRTTVLRMEERMPGRRRREVRRPGGWPATRLMQRAHRQEVEVSRSVTVAMRRTAPRVVAINEPAWPALHSRHDPSTAEDRAGSSHLLTASPAVSVEQLTEQVLRQIDRRVTAWRERTGRG